MKTNKLFIKNAEIDLSTSVSQSTSANRTYFITFIILLVYMSIIVASTTDYQLLIPNSPVRLPFVDTDVPLKMFYLIAPLIILSMHGNLLQNLEVHHHKLIKWRESKTNKRIQRVLIQPFIYDFSVLDGESNFRWFVRLFTNFLFLYFSPILLIILLWRFSSYQSMEFSFFHFLIVIIDLFFVGLFLVSVNKSLIFCCLLFLISLLPISTLGFISYFDSNILWNKLIGKDCSEVPCAFKAEDTDNDGIYEGITYPFIASFMPRISLDRFDYLTFMSSKSKSNDPAFKSINGIDLRYRSLKGALLTNIDFKDAKLNSANLQGANFDNAILTGADMSGTGLEGASFEGANLDDTKLNYAHLNRTNFTRAQLNNANLNNVISKRSDFYLASLKEANLSNSEFIDSQFSSAVLEKANLSGSKFAGSHFKEANLTLAKMNSSKFQGVNFDKADFFLATMSYAELQGSILTNANLDGANLSFTCLQGADLIGATFNAAILNNTKILGIQIDNNKNAFQVQNNNIDTKTIVDWKPIIAMSELKEYRSNIKAAEKNTNNPFFSNSIKFEKDSKSLANLLPKICNHSFEAFRFSIFDSMSDYVSSDLTEIYPKESTIIALKKSQQIKECKVYNKKSKEFLDSSFYKSFGLSKYIH